MEVTTFLPYVEQESTEDLSSLSQHLCGRSRQASLSSNVNPAQSCVLTRMR